MDERELMAQALGLPIPKITKDTVKPIMSANPPQKDTAWSAVEGIGVNPQNWDAFLSHSPPSKNITDLRVPEEIRKEELWARAFGPRDRQLMPDERKWLVDYSLDKGNFNDRWPNQALRWKD